MTTLRDLHEKAMLLAEKGFLAKKDGEIEISRRYFREALELETQAAYQVDIEIENEPTRSILLRSAASLAYECGDFRAAEKLIGSGLSGEPPDEIGQELRDLFDKVNFFRHLEVKGVEIFESDLQVAITGNDIDHDYALGDSVFSRLSTTQSLIYRTSERIHNRPFRESGISVAASRIPVYVTTPRSNSFAITLRLGVNKQLTLPGMSEASPVIEEILDCINLVNDSEDFSLKERIGVLHTSIISLVCIKN